MNICFLVTRGDSIGGAQIHVRDMAIALKADKHEVTVLTGTPGLLTDQLDSSAIPWIHIPALIRSISPLKDLKAIVSVCIWLHRLKPDLLSCHTAKSGMIGRIAAFISGVPVIFTAHGWQFADGIPKKQAMAVLIIEKLVAPLCRRVITVSDYDFTLALRKKAVNPKKMITIHNGLPWRDYQNNINLGTEAVSPIDEVYGKSDLKQPCRLLMVARFQEQKDHPTLLKALVGLKGFNWLLELVGDGDGMDGLKEMAFELGLDSRIEFSGQQYDVPERMDRADIYLLITNWEGFPRSIVEAMRAGIPVISSDVGGCSESVHSGKTGYLVPRGNTEVLRKRIRELIIDQKLRQRMGRIGRVRYESDFTFRKMYEKTVAVYREVLER